MKGNYNECFRIIIGHEGGFQANPRDRGNWTTGKIGQGVLKGTKYGVSAMSYPNLDIRNLTLDDAKAIYKRDFWDRIGADDLPAGLDLAAFDLAVNSGPGAVSRLLPGAGGDYNRLIDARWKFMQGLSGFATFGAGWKERLRRLRLQCAALATASKAVDNTTKSLAGGVLLVPQGGGQPVPWNGNAATYGGVSITADLVSQLRLAYPSPGGPWTYGALKVWRRRNGDIVLERGATP